MKKLFLLLVLVVAAALEVEAQSMLKVRMADNRPVNVWIDGRYFKKRGTSVTIGDLPTGRHAIKIYSVSHSRRGRSYQEVIFHGNVTTYEGMVTLFFYDPYTHETEVKEQYVTSYFKDHPATTPGEWQGETGGNSQDYSRRAPEKDNNEDRPAASPVTVAESGTFTAAKMNKLKSKVSAKKVDTEKMNLLKEALKDETVTTGQVAEMMDWFSFESSKIELAEWAYCKTVDKELYADLEDKLPSKNYKEELSKFLQTKQ